jgi:hypothetical protein
MMYVEMAYDLFQKSETQGITQQDCEKCCAEGANLLKKALDGPQIDPSVAMGIKKKFFTHSNAKVKHDFHEGCNVDTSIPKQLKGIVCSTWKETTWQDVCLAIEINNL